MSLTQSRWYPGAEYHVMLSNAGDAPFFYDGEDRAVYLEMIGKARAEHRFELYAYCLMTDHIHLQIKTDHLPIDVVIHKIDQNYRHFSNRKYSYTDWTYITETTTKPIQSKTQQLEVSKTIHLLPYHASIVSSPKAYKWSSYRSYVDFHELPHVNPSPILAHFSYPQNIQYQQFVEKEPVRTVTV